METVHSSGTSEHLPTTHHTNPQEDPRQSFLLISCISVLVEWVQ